MIIQSVYKPFIMYLILSHPLLTTLYKSLDATRTTLPCLPSHPIPLYPFIRHKPQVSLRPPPPPHTSTMAGAARRSPLFLLGLIVVFLALAAQAFVVPKTSFKGKLLPIAAAKRWLNALCVCGGGAAGSNGRGLRWSRSSGDLECLAAWQASACRGTHVLRIWA